MQALLKWERCILFFLFPYIARMSILHNYLYCCLRTMPRSFPQITVLNNKASLFKSELSSSETRCASHAFQFFFLCETKTYTVCHKSNETGFCKTQLKYTSSCFQLQLTIYLPIASAFVYWLGYVYYYLQFFHLHATFIHIHLRNIFLFIL